MKLISKLVYYIGEDKLLHCFLGGWLVSMFDFNAFAMIVVLAILAISSFVKEYILDESEDIEDILWAVIGGDIAFVIGIFKLILLS